MPRSVVTFIATAVASDGIRQFPFAPVICTTIDSPGPMFERGGRFCDDVHADASIAQGTGERPGRISLTRGVKNCDDRRGERPPGAGAAAIRHVPDHRIGNVIPGHAGWAVMRLGRGRRALASPCHLVIVATRYCTGAVMCGLSGGQGRH